MFVSLVACLAAESTASCIWRLMCPGIQMNVASELIEVRVWRVRRIRCVSGFVVEELDSV